MSERLYSYLQITDLKDMINKTNKLYGERPAYKIKITDGKYKVFTHSEVRDMVDGIRNIFNKYGIKRKKNCSYRRK